MMHDSHGVSFMKCLQFMTNRGFLLFDLYVIFSVLNTICLGKGRCLSIY